MPVVFGPSDDTASLIGMILSLTLLNGLRNIQETTVGKHNPPCHLQMPTKALSCKKEAICEHGPEAPSYPVGQGSFKWTVSKWKSVLWSDESKFHILVGNHRCRVSGLRGGRPSSVLSAFSSKASISDGMGVHKCIQYGQLACLEGTMNAERYIKVLEQHMLPSRWCLFQGRALCISAGQCKTTYHSYYKQHGFVVEESDAELACLQSRSFTPKRTFGASLNVKYVKDDHELFSSWNLYQGRMGPNSNTKTPETQPRCTEEVKRRGDGTPW